MSRRKLTPLEYEAVLALGEQVGSDEQREQLLLDIQQCTVESMNYDDSILRFHIDGYERPPHRGQDTFRGKDRFPVEGRIIDADGVDMDVALYEVYGRIYEVELIKHALGAVMAPVWSSFRLK